MGTRSQVPWLVAAVGLGLMPHDVAATPGRALYDELLTHRLGPPIELVRPGIEWQADAAEWTLEAGFVRLQTPVEGIVSGLWYEGRGRLRLSVPDPVELRQLRRLLKDPSLEELTVPFDAMLLRTSGGEPISLLPPPIASGSTLPAYEDRHDHYLKQRRLDVDAKILAALGEADSSFWLADVHTPDHGWLTITYDSQRGEELSVEHYREGYDYIESWLSLDRSAQRKSSGRPGEGLTPLLDVRHVEIRADLTTAARKRTDWIQGLFETRIDVEILAARISALPLRLHPRAEVTAVTDNRGEPLEFVRDHLGGRSSAIDNEVYDSSLLVLLPTSVSDGTEMSIGIDYRLSLPKYASGRGWYPGRRHDDGLHDLHTARLELTTDSRHELQAMGRLVDQRTEAKRKTSTWELSKPAKMVTFTMQKSSYSKQIRTREPPELTAVGDLKGGMRVLNEPRIDEVAQGTLNALRYLEGLLDLPLPDDHLYVALIPAGHGQAFEGFLHLGEFTTAIDSAAQVERFRAHEVAHQWWGHRVGWHSYRDQWLSEGIAEYLALLFVEAMVDGGEKIFQEAITAYGREVRGSLKSTFSSFARPGYALLTARGAERMGPMAHGWRAGVGEAPNAYQTLAYYKGALVLHMLRVVTRHMTGSEDAFRDILRDFVRTQADDWATTDDLRETIERHVPGDWSWFFDQWAYSAEIPTYLWDFETVPGTEGGTVLRITVEQREVSEGFKMIVPVRLEFGRDTQPEETAILVDQAVETFEIHLPAKPRKVVFNAGDAVIANVKRR